MLTDGDGLWVLGLVPDRNPWDLHVLYLMPTHSVGPKIYEFSPWQKESKFVGFVSEVD